MAAPKKALTAAAILAADDCKIEAVDVPEWGGVVHVKAWSAADREAFEVSIINADGKADTKLFRPKVVAMSLCDKDGELLFPDLEKLPEFLGKNAKVIERLFAISDRLNAVTDAAVDDQAGN